MKKIKGESGQVLIFVALSMTVLLGFMAFATDIGVLLHVKREAQTAADAAAVAGATEALAEGNPSTLTTGEWNAAMNDAAQNGFTATSNGALDASTGTTLTVNIYPTTGNANLHVCNPTAGAVTPAAATFNVRAIN